MTAYTDPQRCAWCHAGGDLVSCPRCRSAAHQECWEGGCATIGCEGPEKCSLCRGFGGNPRCASCGAAPRVAPGPCTWCGNGSACWYSGNGTFLAIDWLLRDGCIACGRPPAPLMAPVRAVGRWVRSRVVPVMAVVAIAACLVGSIWLGAAQTGVNSLRTIAEAARADAEVRAQELGFAEDLQGYCILASRDLFDRLEAAGYEPEFAIHKEPSANHCFVVCDGYVVDVTATQFGQPPVVVIPASEAVEPWWSAGSKFFTQDALERFLIEDECPERLWRRD